MRTLLALAPLLIACSDGGSIVNRTDAGARDATATVDATTADAGTTDSGSPADRPDAGATDVVSPADRPDATASVTVTIGPAGGTVTFNPGGGADRVTLTFPPGAVMLDTPITIALSPSPVPGGFTAVSGIFQFTPAGLRLMTPASVSFQPARPADLAQMDILWSPSATGPYVSVGGRAMTDRIAANITHFSFGFVGRQDADASVAVMCDEGLERCGGVCTDLGADPRNCGTCGNVCPAVADGGLGNCSDGTCFN